MNEYRRLQTWVLRGFGVYLGLALLAIPTRRHEIFPFFCWFLFPLTPNVEVHFVLRVREAAGTPLPHAPPYAEAGPWVKEPHSMDAYVAIQTLGNAITRHDSASAGRAWRLLSGNFIAAPCDAELLRVTADPLELWRGGSPRHTESVAQLKCGELREP